MKAIYVVFERKLLIVYNNGRLKMKKCDVVTVVIQFRNYYCDLQ